MRTTTEPRSHLLRPRRLAAPVATTVLALSTLVGPCSAAQPSAAAALPPLVDVPEYRANSSRTGVFAGPGPVTAPMLVWSRSVDIGIDFNPILADGMILFGGADRFYALDARTGAERWQFGAADVFNKFGSVADGTVAVVSADGILHALDLATGDERWNRLGFGTGTDIVDGVVYAPGADNAAYGIDLATGNVLWSWQAPATVAYITVADGIAYASVTDGRLHAISTVDGTEQWHVQLLAANPGLAEVAGDAVVVSGEVGGSDAETGELDVIDRDAGTLRWQFRTATRKQITAGALSEGVVYAGTIDGSGLFGFPTAADAGGGAQDPLWHTSTTAHAYKNQVLSGDLLYVPTEGPDEILAIDAANGDIRWRVPLAGGPNGILVSGGMLFVADHAGTIAAYAEPGVAAAVGPVSSGPLGSVAAGGPPPDPFTVTATLEPATTGLQAIIDLAVGPDGLLYVIDASDRVSVIDPVTGSPVRTWGGQGTGPGQLDFSTITGNAGVGAIAVGPDGLVYVGDGHNHRYQVFQPDGTFVRQVGSFGQGPGQFSQIFHIAADAQGDVYAVDMDLHVLSKFDAQGGFLWRIGGPGSSPPLNHTFQTVVPRSDGRLFQLVDGAPVVELDPATGAVIDRWDAGPDGTLSFNSAGNAYGLDYDPTRIQVFDPDHVVIGGEYGDDPRLFILIGPHDEAVGWWEGTDRIALVHVDLPGT